MSRSGRGVETAVISGYLTHSLVGSLLLDDRECESASQKVVVVPDSVHAILGASLLTIMVAPACLHAWPVIASNVVAEQAEQRCLWHQRRRALPVTDFRMSGHQPGGR